MPPRIAFIGTGSIGSVVGGLMAEAGHDVTLIDAWADHVIAIQKSGLKLSGSIGDRVVQVPALHVSQMSETTGKFDIVFVSVKSYDTLDACALMLPYASDNAPFIGLQNCINEDVIGGIVGRDRTLGTVTTISTGLYDPGHAMRTDDLGSGVHKTGELNGLDTPRCQQVVHLLGATGTSMATRDLMGERWAKLAHNCGINALVGISGWSTVETLEDASCRRIGIGAVAETLRVADRIGQPVFPIMGMTAEEIVAAVDRRDQDWLDEKMLAYAAGTANTGIASMGQDILKGRRTEIDYLNGYVSTKGREVGIPTPICDALAATVNAGPARQFKSDPGLIDRLAADLRA